ncbi:MAG TPA: alpha-L-arabinofuranosidase C-terminal domain-containing protein [Streptosporangiaceae bacterium]
MALIKVDLDRVVGQVDRRILSGFTEHLGRCVYGGLYDEGSPLSDREGFRTDVLEAVRRLAPPVMRWPGGNFVSGYHWTDGIGPQDQRPRRMDLAWHKEESNRFGTDEFMRFCELVGAEPYLCVNMGTGTEDEAQAWLEYCNGTGNTEWANKRRAGGREAPYGVKYVGLGNEMYGTWQLGQLSAEDYVKKARQFAKVLRWTDPSVELVACGLNGWSDWDEVVIPGLAEFVGWYSIHLYTGAQRYWRNVLEPHLAERAIRITSALIEKARYDQRVKHPIHIAYDEWGVWYREWDGSTGLEERYTLADALAVTTYLHAFLRNPGTVKMANFAQLVNVIAPIVTSPDGMFLQTIYHPLRLFADYLGTEVVNVYVDCYQREFTDDQLDGPRPAHRVADLGPFPIIDVVATRSGAAGQLMLSVINRSLERDITADIRIAGPFHPGRATVAQVNGPEAQTVNSFEQPDAVTVQEDTIKKFGDGISYTFPAHSVTVITVPATDEGH